MVLSSARRRVEPERSVSMMRTRPTPSMVPSTSAMRFSVSSSEKLSAVSLLSPPLSALLPPAGSSISTIPASTISAAYRYFFSSPVHFSSFICHLSPAACQTCASLPIPRSAAMQAASVSFLSTSRVTAQG